MKNIPIESFEYITQVYKFLLKIKLADAQKMAEAFDKSNPEILKQNNYFYKIKDKSKDVAFYWISNKKRSKKFDLFIPIVTRSYLLEKPFKRIFLLINKSLSNYDVKRVNIHNIKFPKKSVKVLQDAGFLTNNFQMCKILEEKNVRRLIANTKLEKMTEAQYRRYRSLTIRDIDSLVRGMGMSKKEAEKNLVNVFKQLAPKGFKDRDNFFMNIIDKSSKKRVGTLWLIRFNARGKKLLFIANISIDEKYRGMGFGNNTMMNIESFARKKRLNKIELNVFDYNDPAKRLYLNSGYKILYCGMYKKF